MVVGDPGAGKSGQTYRLAASLVESGHDVVFIPVDLLNVDNFAELQRELGITHSVAEVLQNWPGDKTALLIADALDAARKLETQSVLRETIDGVRRAAGQRWNTVASVRKYDLRQGAGQARMFRGTPPDAAHIDPEFRRVRHISVARLTDAEIGPTTAFLPQLRELFTRANPQLRTLLRNIFNLHLLADLLQAGVVGTDLSGIRTQSELLETYWRHRVRRDDGRHDAREAALSAMIDQMISGKSLRISPMRTREG
jgi:hypothetical protein